MILVNILLAILSLVFLTYYIVKKKFSYWSDRGVPFVKPLNIPYGNFIGVGKTKHLSTAIVEIYTYLKGKFPYGGAFMGPSPMAIITDLDLVKQVLIRDFNYFNHHGVYSNVKDDPLSYNLFSMENPEWKALRSKLSPTFTSGKMKMMFPTMAAVGIELKDVIDSIIEAKEDVEIKEIAARFTTDIIGTCAFGIDCNSLKEPDNIFREMSRRHFEEPNFKGFKMILLRISAKLARFCGVTITRPDVGEFFTKVVEDTMAYREKNNVKRNDFLNLLIQLKNNGKLDDDTSITDNNDCLTTQECISQAFIFFKAGFETSSTTVSFAMNELVGNPDVQEKLREEIKSVLKNHDGQITYESISEMKYLEQVVYETLRKYPILPFLDRQAVEDYPVPGTKTVIPKGHKVFVPIYAIQRDSEYYPDPEKFDPERFTPENVGKRHPMTFLSFGDGPRSCIGQRFGFMQTKLGIATLILNYRWTPTAKTIYPTKYSFTNIPVLLSPQGGVNIKAEKI